MMHNELDGSSVEIALRYAAAGMSVVPIACDGTKQPPAGQAWKHLQDRIASEDAIRRMFRADAGIAIICGRVSGGLETLDVDDPSLVEPFEAAIREEAPGLLEKLSTVATPRDGGGGRHYRYRIVGDVPGSIKLAQSELRPQFDAAGEPIVDPRTGKQRFAPETLIETRGEGGYAIAPGSPVDCHPSGQPYRHVAGPPLTGICVITAEEHRLLVATAKSFNRYVDRNEITEAPTAHLRADAPGTAFNLASSWEAILEPAGWVTVRQCGALTMWRRPGKDRGVSATTGVVSANGTELFCVFSTNAYPFDGPIGTRRCSSYSKFATYTMLNHDGNYSAAAAALRSNGYGGTNGHALPAATAPTVKAQPFIVPDAFQPFPTNVLPRVCRDFVQQTARSIDCDESMVALPLLSAMAAAIGNSHRIALKRDYSEPAIIWSAVVCESGTRKSPAMEAPIRPLLRREAAELKKYRLAVQEFEEAQRAFRQASGQTSRRRNKKAGESPVAPPVQPICKRFTVGDITTEALAVRLEQNPRGLLQVRDELAGLFGGLNQYKGGRGNDEAAYLQMHGARPLIMDRKSLDKPSIYVPLASLSIVGAIQPGVLRRIFNRERMESGLAARFLMAYPPARVARWRDSAVDGTVQDRLAAMFDRLMNLPLRYDDETGEPTPVLLPLTPEAMALWAQFHDAHADEQMGLHGDLSAAWAKLMGYAARLALVCELAEWTSDDEWQPPTSVDAAALSAGIVLVRWFSAETKRIYAMIDETPDQRECRELIDYIRQRGGVVTTRDLMRGPRRYRNQESLAEADLQRLVSQGVGEWIFLNGNGQGGRPSRSFQLLEALRGDETPSKPEKNEGCVAVATQNEMENAKWQDGKDE